MKNTYLLAPSLFFLLSACSDNATKLESHKSNIPHKDSLAKQIPSNEEIKAKKNNYLCRQFKTNCD
jgi:hypothetical protein